MNIKKATQRITAVAASAALVSSAVFGAGLSNYPGNFGVDKFQGQVVIGAEADSAAATSIIESLAAELSGAEDKVMISYKKASSGSELDVESSNKAELNLKDPLTEVLTADITESDEKSFLADNDVKNKDYTQKLVFGNVDGTLDLVYDKSLNSEAVVGVKLTKSSGIFAEYELAFEDALSADNTDADNMKDFKGEKIEIMGVDYTIKSIAADELVLLGGANEVSLGEGESSTVTVDGVSYEVSVESVATDKVLLTVNGESVTVDEYDSEDVAGTTVVCTEVFSSDRNGYATVVIGGSEIEIKAGEVRVTDKNGELEDISEVHEDMMVKAALDNTDEKLKVTLTWSVDDDYLLEQGGSLNDVLFNAFSLNLGDLTDGGDRIDVTLSASTEEASLTVGDVELGDIFDWKSGTTVELMGDTEDNDFLVDSAATNATFVLDMEDADAEGTRFIARTSDVEDAEIYEIVKIVEEDDDYELTVKVLTDGDREFTVDADELDEEIDLGASAITVADTFTGTGIYGAVADSTSGDKNQYLTFTSTSIGNIVELDNEVRVTFADDRVSFKLDELDIESSDEVETDLDEAEEFTFVLEYDESDDEQIEIKTLTFGSGWTFDRVSESSSDKDNKIGYSIYGSVAEYNQDETQEVTVSIPSEMVSAELTYSTGAVAAAMTMTVAASEADAKVAELEEEGYTVSTKNVEAKEVEFDITAPVMADEVSGNEDMIVVGGPAVNAVAASLLGEGVVGVEEGEAVVRYFAEANSVLVYGYDAAGTVAAANKLNAGGLSGDKVNVQ